MAANSIRMLAISERQQVAIGQWPGHERAPQLHGSAATLVLFSLHTRARQCRALARRCPYGFSQNPVFFHYYLALAPCRKQLDFSTD